MNTAIINLSTPAETPRQWGWLFKMRKEFASLLQGMDQRNTAPQHWPAPLEYPCTITLPSKINWMDARAGDDYTETPPYPSTP